MHHLIGSYLSSTLEMMLARLLGAVLSLIGLYAALTRKIERLNVRIFLNRPILDLWRPSCHAELGSINHSYRPKYFVHAGRY